MSRPPVQRPAIQPVESGAPRPLWSVMIPTWNCAAYLRQTLQSVLSQDPGPETMQIEVVDDESTCDDPEAVARELGADRVSFYRQPRNVGYIRNFNTCLQRSRGRLVHLLHGDDFVRPGFYARLQLAFDDAAGRARVGAAFCRHAYLEDGDSREVLSPLERPDRGVVEGWLEKIAAGPRLATPSIVVRREVYETLGGFDRRFTCAGEDWEMWVRLATRYPVWFEPQPLAVYRVKRTGSLTAESARSSRLVRDMRLAAHIIDGYLAQHLPTERARDLVRNARRTYARWALEAAEQGLATGAPAASVITAVTEALRCSLTRATVRDAVGICARQLRRRRAVLPAEERV